MKISNLKNRLAKLNAEVRTEDLNGFNMLLVFTINGKTYEADFDKGEESVSMFTYTTGNDEASQETTRRFFETFSQVLRHSNN